PGQYRKQTTRAPFRQVPLSAQPSPDQGGPRPPLSCGLCASARFFRGPPMKKESAANELLGQALQGDREALGRLLEAERAAVHRLAERQLAGRIAVRVDASDIIQQTFLEAYRSFPQFDGQDVRELGAWLQRILDHKIAGAIRDHALLQKRKLSRERSMDDSGGGGAPLKQELEADLSSPSQNAIPLHAP